MLSRPDVLRPSWEGACEAWAQRVRAYKAQTERSSEVDEPADFYEPLVRHFARDPRRHGDASLDQLLGLARPDDEWLDIGAGAGRYALPLALKVRSVRAVEPSASMSAMLRAGIAEHEIDNVVVDERTWPTEDAADLQAEGVLMAHVGYSTEDMGSFVDAVEAAAGRVCVAIMRASSGSSAAAALWQPIHGEPRLPLPALPEFLLLLLAQGALPDVRMVAGHLQRATTLDELVATSRRHLRLRPGSDKDRRLEGLVRERAVQTADGWTLGPGSDRVGVVSWAPQAP